MGSVKWKVCRASRLRFLVEGLLADTWLGWKVSVHLSSVNEMCLMYRVFIIMAVPLTECLFIEHLLCAEHITCIISFCLPCDSMRQVLFSSPFFGQFNEGSAK